MRQNGSKNSNVKSVRTSIYNIVAIRSVIYVEVRVCTKRIFEQTVYGFIQTTNNDKRQPEKQLSVKHGV